jgi:hypothetical protein
MKKLRLLFVLVLTTLTVHGQDETNKKERKFSIGLEFADYNQQIKENDDHLTNESAYSQGLKISYRFSERYVLKSGFQFISDVSFSGLTYDQYKIPLLLSFDISFNNKKINDNTRLIADAGFYLRSINDLENNTAVNYNKNTVFGFQGALSVEHDITELLFVNLGVRVNNDFSDLLESADSNISINSYGFFFGAGVRL